MHARKLLLLVTLVASIGLWSATPSLAISPNSCEASPGVFVSFSFNSMTAASTGGCNPRGTVTVRIFETRAPYRPVIVARGSCTNHGSRPCTARVSATRRAGATYRADSVVTAA